MYSYYSNKSIPIGNITVCATNAANPGMRQNKNVPDNEDWFTFKLSVRPTCGGKSLHVEQQQARPHTHARTRRLLARGFRPVLAPILYSLVLREYPEYR
jgi:hypothetical protein